MSEIFVDKRSHEPLVSIDSIVGDNLRYTPVN